MTRSPRHRRVAIAVSVLAVVVLSLALVPDAFATHCFADVPDSHWAGAFICWMQANGVSAGYPDGTYRPDNNVTRAELAVFSQRVHQLSRWGQTWTGTGDGLVLAGTAPTFVVNSTTTTDDFGNILFRNQGIDRFGMGIDPFDNQNRDFYIYDYDNSSYRLYMHDDGRTGIGTTTPETFLHSRHSDAGAMPFSPASGTAVYGESANDVGVWGDSGAATGVVGMSGSLYGGYFSTTSGSTIILGYDGGTGNTRFRAERNGNVLADGAFTGPADFAELLSVAGSTQEYEPGDILVIGPEGLLRLSTSSYDTSVIGVLSSRPGFLGDTQISDYGLEAADAIPDTNRVAVAILGIVPVKVSVENGSIAPGDLLTTSSTPGHAMKCTDKLACFGAVIGKALEGLQSGTGIIRVLVTLR